MVVVAVAAGALAFDSRRGVSIFLRTRASSIWQLLQPRMAVLAAAAVLAYTVGLIAAWYETALLLGPLPAGPVLAGLICQAVYLTFAVTVVAAASSLARSTLATVGIALTALILLSVAGAFPAVHDWLPSTLAGAQAELLGDAALTDFLPALAVGRRRRRGADLAGRASADPPSDLTVKSDRQIVQTDPAVVGQAPKGLQRVSRATGRTASRGCRADRGAPSGHRTAERPCRPQRR